MENTEPISDTSALEGEKNPEKAVENPETNEIVNEESKKTDAIKTIEDKPTQNGDAGDKENENIEEKETQVNSNERSLRSNKMSSSEKSKKASEDIPDKPSEPPSETPIEKPPVENDKSVEKTEDKSTENQNPADKPEEKPKEKSPEKPAEKVVEKSNRVTRGIKRKVNDTETVSEKASDSTERKENVASKSNENVASKMNEHVASKNNENVEYDSNKDDSLTVVSNTNVMGKGKRARIPNKRYSDIILSPNRKYPKSGDTLDPLEISIKEEPIDSPVVSAVSSPVLPSKKQRMSISKENLQDPKYLKPFKYGWKRELVWRSTSTASKPVGDIYYYTPVGKKVRSSRELADYLPQGNKNLTIDNFSFTKEPLGIDDPEKEIIRDAKIKSAESFSESPVPKKVETLKKPKILSPKISTPVERPKTPRTPTKVEISPKKDVKELKVETPKTPKLAPKNTPVSSAKKTSEVKMPVKRGRPPSSATKKPKLAAKNDEATEVASSSPPVRALQGKTSKPCQPCSINCEGLEGVVPTLQCSLCLCLYHYECVGLRSTLSYPYVCKNCHIEQGQNPNQSTTIVSPPPLTPINSLKSVSTPASNVLPKLQRIPRPDSADPLPVFQPVQSLPPLVEIPDTSPGLQPSRNEMPKLIPKPGAPESVGEQGKGLVGSVTSWLPHNVKLVNSEEPTEAPRPQYLEYLAGRKFLVIPKHNFMSVSSGPSRFTEEPVVAVPTIPSIPKALQPTEIPGASASLGPSTSNLDNSSQKEAEISCETSRTVWGIKAEPLSPSKADNAQPFEPMEVDGEKEDNVGVDGLEREKGDGDVQEDDEASQQANAAGPKLKKRNLKLKSITNTNTTTIDEKNETKFMENYLQNLSFGYNTLLYVFQYLKVQDLLRAGCVCTMWRDIASHPILWRTVRMKNSQVHSFEGLANTLKKHGTVHLDLRKMLLPSNGDEIWPEFSKAIARVDTLRKIELCRCPATVVEQLAVTNPTLEVINAVTIKCESMNLNSLSSLTSIRELRLKSTSGLNITSIDSLKELKSLKILSLTSVNDLHQLNLSVISELTNLESLDLGECTDFPKNFGEDILSKLENLEKLRLEKGQGVCHTFEILDAVKEMKKLEQLELVNFDVKAGFDKALGKCTNIKKLMIIPTYISQSATTNNMVLSGVLRLQGSLTHFVWGVTLELLRVTELFVDQCEEPKDKKEKKPVGNGDSIPVLKPVPDLTHSSVIQAASNPPQVEILPLPNLQKLLLNSLPTTRVKILKIPFHATWRQTLTDSV